ncbi:nitrate reductase [Insolitispirillum peregrinum]|uniref:Assimilatory nitrate reductase (NADH) alpha subunit apoprotein n=1 Tax=Insolitispirillum peregrinum TaxID=80876 RepID=A0A1N7IS50_9PROT|nr:nitrate reductase [Insolitispirillum peregrinum]SIS39924.1 assimilatory nitrate reductase (NADH) alpha subunit apoprotein [Insolitispirillum peregrinum]
MTETCTTCPYCGVGCGVVVTEGRTGWSVGGDASHPANLGRLCSKGSALTETLRPEGRLLYPTVDGQRRPWSEAVEAVASRLQETLDQYGPSAVAFYVSGQLLTEDYYVANKLLKGFVGSPHIDTNSRLCMASTVVGHKRAFGADVVPGSYEDIELAELVLLVGSNLAWCHPVLHQRLLHAQRQRGTRLIVIDPRRSASCDTADLHLPLAPGSDVMLFNGLLAYLEQQNAISPDYLTAHVDGAEQAFATARTEAGDIATVARHCQLSVEAVLAFYQAFATTARTVTVFSQGVNQSSQGSDKVNAILNCHLATGRVGKPGSTPFSVTGQPNAMGGREVGGLANQLAAHMNPNDPADVERLGRFWQAPALRVGEGLKAIDMFRAIHDGRIKFLWVMATNPAVSLPESDMVRDALARCPTVVVSDVIDSTDTLRHAHITLPAAAWGEKDGTVTNSERRISRQRPFLPLPGEARPDWWIISAVGTALGHGAAFDYHGPADIFREHARLSGFENDGRRAFDISGLATISTTAYHQMPPIQWPVTAADPAGTARLYGDGLFTHPNGKARMLAVAAALPKEQASADFPLILNTGRYRDQWHTMTRTGLSPRLSAHRPEPLLEIHPADAARHGLEDGQLAQVHSRHGELLVRIQHSDSQRQGDVFLPIHWSDSNSAKAVVSRLISAHADPFSGQPESKHMPVSVAPFATRWSGLLFLPADAEPPPALATIPYWCRHSGTGASVIELAGDQPEQWNDLHHALQSAPGHDYLQYQDQARSSVRLAWLRDGRLQGSLFIAKDRPTVARGWMSTLFASTDPLAPEDRVALLAGQAPRSGEDQGPLVCACLSVGLKAIQAAVTEGRAATAEEIGKLLGAGTGCGSCVSEIKEIIRHAKPAVAA